jgi:hypothetical protein
MAQLKNPRHELMAQAIASGKTQAQAHKEAGYKGTADGAKMVLREHPEIRDRVAELLAATAAQTVKGGVDVINGLWAVFEKMKELATGKGGGRATVRISAANAMKQQAELLGRHYRLWDYGDGDRAADTLPLAERLKQYRKEESSAPALIGGSNVVSLKREA